MRVTNNMIMTKANTNINGTKVIVDKENTQMTTQKKIDRPSEDPVVAVRSLRLATQLAKIDQYYEKNIPDADLIIRTSGEERLSNFLVWQASYSELMFTDTLWPDFSNEEFEDMIFRYMGRERRFGGRNEEDK